MKNIGESGNELLPCPFCREKDDLRVTNVNYNGVPTDIIVCGTCEGGNRLDHWQNRQSLKQEPTGASGWRPIAEAPKDGTRILLANNISMEIGRFYKGWCSGKLFKGYPIYWTSLPSPPTKDK